MSERAGSSAERSPLVLASASPRRRWLLHGLGVRFEVLALAVDERMREGEGAALFAARLADEKAYAGSMRRRDAWVLAADTVVALGPTTLGKPADAAQATAMLTLLSGRVHTVHTAVALMGPGGVPAERVVVATRVGFRRLAAEEIHAYVATGEPLDKAGAYAIQGEGACLIDRIDGSYTNVIGLPVAEIEPWLRAWQRT
jgi:septum formation protein